MNKAKRFVFSLSTLIFFSGIALATAPVYARSASAHDAVEATSTSTTGTETETEVETHGQDLAQQFRQQAKAKIAAAKSQHSLAQKQQACTARQAGLTKRMANAVRNATVIKGVIDDKFTKVQDFYTAKNLNVTDYDTMKTAVSDAQAKAADSLSALQATDVTIDCTAGTAAETVSAFQAAVSSTRDSLKAYRTSLVDLINSLKGASTSTTKTDETQPTDQTTQTDTTQTNTTNTNQ
jgi:hypothetical protein